MTGSRVTLREVAREAGVHTSTASRALNPATRSVVNPETVRRVLAVAEHLGYRPHLLARGLRTNRTMTVGMVIPDIENPFFAPIIGGVEQTLGSVGYSLLIGNTDNDDTRARSVVTTLVERRVDGLVLATASRDDVLVDYLLAEGVPMVLVNRYAEGTPVPAVLGDDHAGIGLAVEHLVSLGHTAIGHVGGPQSLSTGLQRRLAFLDWMGRMGLAADPDLTEEAVWFQRDPGHQAATALLDRHPEITAIVAANDLLALGCYLTAADRALKVGSDLSVTGYNDMPLVDQMQPPLTSVRVPFRQMGVAAATMLLPLMVEGSPDDEPPPLIRLAPTLVVRESTASPSRR